MYVSLEHLNKSFDGKPVVKNLNMELDRGEILCFLGSSGCGKTTTLKMIGGFLSPDHGRILLDGDDITGLPPEERPVSTVFQSYALFPNMTVLQNVIYGLKFRGIKKKAAVEQGREYLSLVGLLDWADSKVHQISGGQQQRVALARALIVHPKLLLLDEPLSNLDARLRIRMRNEIRDIRRKFDVTMIFVTHDQEEAMSIADRVAIMNEGRLLQCGSPQEIYEHPADEFVMHFLGSANRLELPGEKPLLLRPEDLLFDQSGPVSGVITGREYLGFYWRYTVHSAGATLTVYAMEKNPREIGAPVRLALRTSRSLL